MALSLLQDTKGKRKAVPRRRDKEKKSTTENTLQPKGAAH